MILLERRQAWESAVERALHVWRDEEQLSAIFEGTNGFWIAEFRQLEPGRRPRYVVLLDADGDTVPYEEPD